LLLKNAVGALLLDAKLQHVYADLINGEL
jgi:hypothetical protein